MKGIVKPAAHIAVYIAILASTAFGIAAMSGCDGVASKTDTVTADYIAEERKALNLDEEEDNGTAGIYPLPAYRTDVLATEDQAAAASNIKAIYVDDFGDLSKLREYPGFDEESLEFVQKMGTEKLQYQAFASADIVVKSLKKRYGLDFKVSTFISSFNEYDEDEFILHCYQDEGKYSEGVDIFYYPNSGLIYDGIYADMLEEKYGESADRAVDAALADMGLADKVVYDKQPKFAGTFYAHSVPVEDDIIKAEHIFAHYTFAATTPQTEQSLEALANDIVAALERASFPAKFTLMYNAHAFDGGTCDFSLVSAPDTLVVTKNALYATD